MNSLLRRRGDLLPRPLVELSAVDLGMLAGSRLLGRGDPAFIKIAVGANGRNQHGDTKEED